MNTHKHVYMHLFDFDIIIIHTVYMHMHRIETNGVDDYHANNIIRCSCFRRGRKAAG